MTVADRIKYLREQLGMTQEELAKKMGYTGKSSISKIETSGNNVTIKKIARLAPILNTSNAYLMGWTDNPDPNYQYSNEFVSELATNANRNMRNIVMKAFHPENDTKEESNANPKLEEWIAFFNELSDDQQDEAMEFLRLFVGARPEARSSLVSLLKTLGS